MGLREWLGRGRAAHQPRRVPASQEMRDSFGFEQMAHPDDARAWFEALWQRVGYTPEARDYFGSLRLEIGSLDEPLGGGYWFGDRRLVLLRGAQEEAAIHELAHAWWEPRRAERRDELMALLRQLGSNPPADTFPRIAELAQVYCHGIPSQPDPSSPTGSWRGMLAEDNDHETFAGFCSGAMANAQLMPPPLRAFYRGLLPGC